MLSRFSVYALVALCLAGCATTQVALPGATDRFMTQLAMAGMAPIDGPRRITGGERERVVRRIDQRIRPAVERVCRRYFGVGHPCTAEFADGGPSVVVGDNNINAYIDQDNNIHVLGGLVAWSGSDDELAFVLAHEYAHGLFDHVGTRMSNMGRGLLAGLGAGAAVGLLAGVSKDEVDDVLLGGAAVGATVGGLVFSKSMELEADHMAMFIMDDAGYDVEKGMHFFQRSIRYEAGQRRTGGQGRIGFFQTHPSDRDRLLNQLATIDAIRNGAVAPVPKDGGR